MSDKKEKFGFKLVITGNAGCGKTSLIRRYADNKFDENYKPSIGADFTLKVINFPGYDVILTCWDIGGQDLFDSLRNYYYFGSNAALIVFDVTRPETLDRIQTKWLPDIRTHVGDIPVLILANKVDLEEERKVSKEVIEQKSKELGIEIIETSAKTGENVKKAFETIAKMCFK
ncbi:MAG: Rab family GTPase [Candidatus Helarchaeota archaeon]